MKPVIIVYAKAPIPGRVNTRLIPKVGSLGAAQLHEAFAADTLSIASSLSGDFDVELHTDVPTEAWSWSGVRRLQCSGDLGRRMYTTLSDALAAGRPFALIIGSDSPTLPAHFLVELVELLHAKADVVLGPTRDGGYYAIGCRRVHAEMFAGVTWSSATTLAQTLDALRRCGLTAAVGPEWFDVDEPEDLELLEGNRVGACTHQALSRLGLYHGPGRVSPWLSIIVPTLNESSTIGHTLEAISGLGQDVEVIVVDGESEDGTTQIARERGVAVLSASPGRGHQLRLGAAHATGEVFWFLHADSIPPPDAKDRIREALRDARVIAGNFDLIFDGGSPAARNLTRIYPHLRKLGLCYGDSGVFVRREAYEAAGGVRPYPIFEDLDLIKRIRQRGRFVHLDAKIVTSSRRFEGRNFGLVFAKWTAMQILYWMGVHPRVLGRWYAPVRAGGKTN
jgi:rSAM/selenodomain-associated transferase 2/rSAM/selenodomain-associated transferase 1